jgi:hypothetical protein
VDMGGEEVEEEVVAADPAKNPAVNWFTFAQIFPDWISYFSTRIYLFTMYYSIWMNSVKNKWGHKNILNWLSSVLYYIAIKLIVICAIATI